MKRGRDEDILQNGRSILDKVNDEGSSGTSLKTNKFSEAD